MNFAGRKAAVVGLGRSNLPLIRFLTAKGVRVTGCDKKTASDLDEQVRKLEGAGIALHLGPDYLAGLSDYDLLFLTPGMRKDLPEIAAARAKGVVVSSEMGLFFELCTAPVLGITGSSGKTTTTMLTGKMMEASTKDQVLVGGNIGQVLIEEAERIPRSARVVLELSSFQLEELTRSPHIAVITNITPNHLDQHASMEEYVDAKKHIFRFQTPDDFAVLNYDDPTTRAMRHEAPGQVAFFSRRTVLESGAYVRDGDILITWDGQTQRICRTDELKLIGEHNVENVLAAAMAAYLFGATVQAIRAVATTFTGAPHRLELVRDVGGVRYYNDSIATTPARAMAGLASFQVPIVLIAGGYDKKLPFDEFANLLLQKVKGLVLLGVTKPLIRAAVERAARASGHPAPPTVEVEDFAAAVAAAAGLAEAGDVVLLSPACASYDMFRNFEERGQLFRELVRAL